VNLRLVNKKIEHAAEGSRDTQNEARKRFAMLIEELQASRVHFHSVVEKNVDGMIVINADGAILYMNPAAEMLFGKEREELIGQSFGIPEDSDSSIEIDFKKPNGTIGTGEMRTAPTEWEGEKAVLISVRDITQRKRAEAEILELNQHLEKKVLRRTEQLEMVNRELESFNYTVSHDLRAPLARIDGYASLLMDELAEKLSPDCENYLNRIRAAVTNMVELTEGLLQLSRLTKRKLEIQDVDLGAAAEQIIENLRQSDPGRAVEAIIAPDLKARGDPVLLRAVLANLLGNAWKFTQKRDRAEIEVGVKDIEGEKVFFVRDNGAGFDMSRLDELFTPFKRLHDNIDFSGTGIGLSTVQRIVHRHRGRVWAEAEADKGATFYFTLGN
jgi:signal transduction histidine kinase